MAKEYVPIFFDWLETTQDLNAEEKGNLIDAVVSYAAGEEYEHFLTGGCKIAFRFLKGQVDRNAAISEKRSKAGAIKPEQEESNEIKQEQKKSNEIKDEQKKQVAELFDEFWASYPRHEAKATALKAFEKLKPDKELLSRMLLAIDKYKKSEQWQESGGKYIPHPATWLNQKRWEDEPPAPMKKKGEFTQRDYSSVPSQMLSDLEKEIEAFNAREVV